MRVLVTGAAGFIGRYLLQALREQGATLHAVLIAHWLSDEHGLGPDVTGHVADLRDSDAIARVVDAAQPERVFHLAAAGVTNPFLPVEEALAVNVHGTINLLQALDGRAPVVVARTPGEDDALNVYAASKGAAWQFCRMYQRVRGWSIVGARVFSAYGAGQSPRNLVPAAVAAAAKGDDFPLTPGEQRRDWIDVRDVAAGLMAVGDHAEALAGETVDIGTGEAVSVLALVEQIYAGVGRGGAPKPGARPYRPGEVMQMVADAADTAEKTGWRARYSLAEGLAGHLPAMVAAVTR